MTFNSVLITGGAGFIGTELCKQLISINQKIKIVIYDNLHSQVHGSQPTFRALAPQIIFIRGDVQDQSSLVSCIKEHNPAIIYHLAAETGTGQSYDEPVRYCSVNVGGTANLIEAIRSVTSVKKVILAGSRAVYGEGAYSDADGRLFAGLPRTAEEMAQGNFNVSLPSPARPPFQPAKSDSRLPPMPASIYASTKLMQEYLLTQAAENANWKCSILRFQNVYGAGQSLNNPYTGVLSIFAKKLMSGANLAIFEDGEIARDFVYVDDVVRALVALKDTELANGEIIDIGYGEPTTILEVSTHLSRMLSVDPTKNIITGQYRAGDIRYACANIEKAKALLNWNPQITIQEGLQRLVNWVKAQGN
jgi:dTDP-L-rhamnose 4-epimerase